MAGYETITDETLRSAALANPYVGEAFLAVPPISTWVPFETAHPWFSPYHFHGTQGFALPFRPQDCLWSPDAISLPVYAKSEKRGYYRRGVAKYVRCARRGEPIPPVSFVFTRTHGWALLDGNHRYEAHVIAGRPTIKALFAVPRDLISFRDNPC